VNNKNLVFIFVVLACLLLLAVFLNAIGFAQPSHASGQADYGNNTGNFTKEANSFTATQVYDSIYYAMERGNGRNVSANQTLGFNISFISTNKSKIIRLINGSIFYCHSRKTTSECDGGATPQGTSLPMRITILNVSGSKYEEMRSLLPSSVDRIQVLNFSLNFTQNFSNYINSSQFITLMFDFNWTGEDRTSFLNDFVNITIFYDTDNAVPNVSLVTPVNNTRLNLSAANFTCAATDNFNLTNIAIYTNISGAFVLNQTVGVSGTANTSIFEIASIPDGTFMWNCQAKDIADFTNFSVSNFTFSVDTVAPKVINLTPFVSQVFNQTQSINITANVSDVGGIDKVFVNITLPNANTVQTEMTGNGDIFNLTFTNTLINGQYNVTYIANDTSKNTNRSISIFFNVNDVTAPAVAIIEPNASAIFILNQNVTVKINATDYYVNNTDKVFGNITLPNGTVSNLTLINTVDGFYNFTFNQTDTAGKYVLAIFANDTGSNVNASVNQTFFVINNSLPVVSIAYPENNAYNNTGNITFSCSANSSNTLSDITLFINASGVFSPNQTVIVGGSSNTSNFTVSNIPESKVLWNCEANDTANSAFSGVNKTVIIDKTAPSVSNVQPASGSTLAPGAIININATVIDNEIVNSFYVSILSPNSLLTNVSMYLLSGNVYQGNFSNTARAGIYNATFIATDSAINVNSSIVTSFTVVDSTVPSITLRGCTPTQPEPFQSVMCNATIADGAGIDVVRANVAQPTTGTVFAQTIQNVNNNYFFNFTSTTKNGTYFVSWFANDTNNNSQNATNNFTVIDTIAPSILLVSPEDGNQANNRNLDFIFKATDNFDSVLSCTLWINNTINQTNSNVANNTQTSFSATSIMGGSYNWNITCIDGHNNFNSSVQREFIVDTGAPEFNSLTYIPSLASQLKPNVQINFTANVSDNISGVSSVQLGYKLSADVGFTNITMNSLGNSLYSASFIPSAEGAYNFRLHGVDNVGNSGDSAIINITAALQRTWEINPAQISKSTSTNQDITLGNFTINNTGDFALNFSIDSDYANTRFNVAFPLQIAAGQKAEIQVNVTTPATTGVTIVHFVTTATLNGTPASINTAGNIAIGVDQPILVASLSIPSAVTQGTSRVLSSTLKNIGDGNATNVTFFYILPSGWTVSIGTQNISVGDLLPNETAANNIQVDISNSASTGNHAVIANSSGQNGSGTDVGSLGLIIGASNFVDVVSPAAPLGSGRRSGGSGESGGQGSSEGSVGGGNGVGVGGKASSASPSSLSLVKTLTTEEFIATKETVNLVRGETATFPLKVTNVFENAKLFNIKLDISGYLAQYLSSSPDVLNDIEYTKRKSFTINVASPAYNEKGVYDMVFTIKGDAVAKDFVKENGRTVEINSIKHFTEKRTVTLNIHEISPELAIQEHEQGRNYVQEMADAQLSVRQASYILEQLQKAYDANDFGMVDSLIAELKNTHDNAIESKELMDGITARIDAAAKRGIDTSETKRLLVLAQSALEREDYFVALQRLREAQVIEMIETRRAFNILVFLKRFWWLLALAGAVLTIAGLLAYRKILIKLIAKRIADLSAEEVVILGLMRDAQVDCFKDKKISITEYHKMMYQYEQRIERIKNSISKLRTRRIVLSTLEEEFKQLKAENARVFALIKEAQEMYFVRHTLNRAKYLKRMEEYRIRIAEIEESIAVIESKIANREAEKKAIKEGLKIAITTKNIIKAIDKAKSVKERAEKNEHSSEQRAIAALLSDAISKQSESNVSKNESKIEVQASVVDAAKTVQVEKSAVPAIINSAVRIEVTKTKPNKIISMLKDAYNNNKSDFFSFDRNEKMTGKNLPEEKNNFEITLNKIKTHHTKKEFIRNFKEVYGHGK